MTIALRAMGTATAATAAVTAVNPAVPTGATTGDLSVLTVWAKPYNTAITTPGGWTKIGEHTNGTTAAGTDSGSTKVAVYVLESAAVGAIGNIGQTSANTMGAAINTYAKSAGTWDYSAFTQGFDATNDANYSATGAAGIAVATGDWVLQSTAANGDAGTVSGKTIGGMAGATLGAVVSRQSAAITTGTDCRGFTADIPVTAGSSSAAPTYTYINTVAGSGTTMWLRLRETTGATNYNGTASLPATATTTSAGVVGRVIGAVLAATVAIAAAGIVDAGGGASVTLTAGVKSEDAATSLTVTLPTGLADGDWTIIPLELAASAGSITTPSGWTAVFTAFASQSTANALHGCYIRKWVSGDADPAFAHTLGRCVALPIKVSGADPTTLIGVVGTDAGPSGTTTSVTAPSVTPTSPGVMIAFTCGGNPTAGAAGSGSTPTGMTLILEVAATSASTNPIIHASSLTVGSGATGTKVSTFTAALRSQGSSLVIYDTGGVTGASTGASVPASATITASGTVAAAGVSSGATIPATAAVTAAGVVTSVPPLGTAGNKIVVDGTSTEVLLRGANVMRSEWTSGYSTVWEQAAIPELKTWGGNVIVRGFASDPVNSSDAQYLAMLDEYVSLAQTNDMYVVFVWRSDAANGAQPSYPDDSAKAALPALAARYKGNAHVMYGLQVEPNPAPGSGGPTWAFLRPIFETMVDDIRAASAPYEPIVMVPGTSWSKDLRGAITDPVARSNIVYKTHAYEPNADYQAMFGDTYNAGLPVFVGEFAPANGATMTDMAALISFTRSRGIGWAAWWMDYSNQGTEALVVSATDLSPTDPWGIAVRTALTTLAATVAIVAAGVVGVGTGGSVPATATITAAGTVAAAGINSGAAIPATATLASAGFVGKVTAAALSSTATLTAAGVRALATGSSLAETATLTAAGIVATSNAASLAGTATITTAGVVARSTGAALPATATITTAGQVTTAGQGTATLAAGDTITATGVVARSTGSTLTATGTLTAAGDVGAHSTSTRTATATLTAAGIVAGTGTATLTGTGQILAAGTMASAGTTILDSTATITAAGEVADAYQPLVPETRILTVPVPDRDRGVSTPDRALAVPAGGRARAVPAQPHVRSVP